MAGAIEYKDLIIIYMNGWWVEEEGISLGNNGREGRKEKGSGKVS